MKNKSTTLGQRVSISLRTTLNDSVLYITLRPTHETRSDIGLYRASIRYSVSVEYLKIR